MFCLFTERHSFGNYDNNPGVFYYDLQGVGQAVHCSTERVNREEHDALRFSDGRQGTV